MIGSFATLWGNLMSYRRAVLTALTLSTAAAMAATPAIAVPSEPSDPATTDIDVICDAIGEDTVTVTGDLAEDGDAKITRGPLEVVGEPGFTGTDSSGAIVDVKPTGEGSVCTAQTDSTGDDLAAVLPQTQADKAKSSGKVRGHLTFTVKINEAPTPLSAQRSAQAQTTAAASLPFEAELRTYLNSRPGAVGVAVRLPGTGKSWTYTKTSSRNVTASIVKVQIMAAVMMNAQNAGRSLTSWEKSQMSPMIRNSDNNAATALFNHIGGRTGLDRAASRLGMTATTADPYNHWGLTSTTAADQAKLMEHFARPSARLNSTNRSYGLSLMRNINSSQRWGVSAGPPSGRVALKNGWLPRTDGWHVNSIGWSDYGDADYTIGVLTHHNPGTMNTQIATIEGVSRIVYKNRKKLLPAARGIKGDIDGDGKVDLLGAKANGDIYLMRGTNTGAFQTGKRIATGLSDATWFGQAGDVNRDGRSDVLVRRGDGRLQLMLAGSGGTLGTPKTIREGWNAFTTITAGGDVDGNGKLDVLTRKADGGVSHFEMSDTGALKRVRWMGDKVAKDYPTLMLVADVNGDGRDDLRAISPTGRMRALTSTGTDFKRTSVYSNGWKGYRVVTSPGDVNASKLGQDDVVAVPDAGAGRVYMGEKGGGQTKTYRTTRARLGLLPHVF